jgi:hypothetical protein
MDRGGMNINILYDSSVGLAPANFKAAVAYAVQLLDNLFASPVTINVAVGYGEFNGEQLPSAALGESYDSLQQVTYSQLLRALPSGTLPATDPTQGGTLFISTAEAVALGLSTGGGITGYVGFSSTQPFSYDPYNRAVSGQYDFIGVVEHEITEVLGRISLLSANEYSLMDLFRYSAPGVHNFVGAQPAYFSIDGGETNLNNFNTNPGGDFGDWAISAGNDSFLAFNNPGVINTLSSADIALMNLLGYGAPVSPLPAVASITSITEQPSSGDVGVGKQIMITLNLSAPVNVAGGAPALVLNDGGVASYTNASGGNALNFQYTVGAHDASVASLGVTGVNLNGATIKDGAGNLANLSLSGLTQNGPRIDTTIPTVTSITELPNTADLNVGKTVVITLNLNEPVTVSGGTPTLTLNNGGVANYSTDSGGGALNFLYVVGAHDASVASLAATAATLNGATISDATGNTANLSLAGLTQNGPQIDTTIPSVISVVEQPNTGDLIIGNTAVITLNLNEPVTVAGGIPTLDLNNGGVATYSNGSGSSTLDFLYTVATHDASVQSLTVTSANLNGAAISDPAGNAATLSLVGLSQNGPQVDVSSVNVQSIQSDYLAILRTALPLDQATPIVNAITSGTQTETQYVNSLLSQVSDTTIPAVAVDASMYGMAGSSTEITKLVTQFLPPQIANATQHDFNPLVYASEALGLAFASSNETGSTAFAANFGPTHAEMANSPAGDAAFAAAAAADIFGAASTSNLIDVLDNFVINWKSFYATHGIPGISGATPDQIDLAARGAAWGDAVGVALANNLGDLYQQTINFLEDAAHGTAAYSSPVASQPSAAPFQGEAVESIASAANSPLIGLSTHLEHYLI